MKLRILLAVAVLAPATVLAGSSAGEIVASGFVFANPEGAKIREETNVDAKVLIAVPGGQRLVYRRFYEIGGKRTWYYVTPVGKPAGWVSGDEISTKRSGLPPEGKVLELKDSGLGEVKVNATMTAAARGLDDRAKRYGEKQDMKKTVDQFITIENKVGELMGDPPAADGTFNDDKDTTSRKAKANEWKAGLKK